MKPSKILKWVLVSCFLLFNFSSQTLIAKTAKKTEEPQITPAVIEALNKGNLNEAAIVLRDQTTSAKSLYLLREVTRIVMFETSQKHPKRSEAHQFYQNLGVAYHNLFLFLKANGETQEEFFKKAIKFYKKAKGYATPMHKQEIDILTAALLTSNSDNEKADKIIGKIDMEKIGADFQMQECLASYYAAKGDSNGAISSLKTAYRERPDIILTWLAVGDDFYPIKDDPEFAALLKDWHFERTKRQLELKLPRTTPPKLQFAEPAVQFRHPTAPQAQPHYRKKKAVLHKARSKTKASKAKKSNYPVTGR